MSNKKCDPSYSDIVPIRKRPEQDWAIDPILKEQVQRRRVDDLDLKSKSDNADENPPRILNAAARALGLIGKLETEQHEFKLKGVEVKESDARDALLTVAEDLTRGDR